MRIHYYVDRRGRKVGSVNYEKIEKMGEREMGRGAKVGCCDIADFEGKFLSGEWNG